MTTLKETKITTHWWNMGKKKEDFHGTIKEFLDLKGIKVSKVFRQDKISGFKFTNIAVSSRVATLTIWGYDPVYSSLEAIKIFLTMLGDKATISTMYGRKICVNF
jgi:hypothetical protein